MTILKSPTKRVLPTHEAALYLGYDGATATFYAYVKAIDIHPLSDRKGAYDRVAIDAALDRASGLEARTDFGAVTYGDAKIR